MRLQFMDLRYPDFFSIFRMLFGSFRFFLSLVGSMRFSLSTHALCVFMYIYMFFITGFVS